MRLKNASGFFKATQKAYGKLLLVSSPPKIQKHFLRSTTAWKLKNMGGKRETWLGKIWQFFFLILEALQSPQSRPSMEGVWLLHRLDMQSSMPPAKFCGVIQMHASLPMQITFIYLGQ